MRGLSQVISYLFHPALVPLIGVALILFGIPYYLESTLFYYVLGMVVLGTYVFPVMMAYLLLKLQLIPDLTMQNARDRRWPFIISIVFFGMTAQAMRQLPIPEYVPSFIWGGALTIGILWVLLPFQKASAHMAGMGGILSLLIFLSTSFSENYLLAISLQFVFSGFVATARLYLKAHTPRELITGFFTGFVSTTALLIYSF